MKAFLKKEIKVDIGVCQENKDSAIVLLFLNKKVIPFRIESPQDISDIIKCIEEA